MKTVLYVILGLIGIGIIATCGDDSSSEETKKKDEKVELTIDQSNLLNDTELDGNIEIKEFDNEVWVKPLLWNMCNFQAKSNLAYLSAIKCGNAQGSTNYSCTVYDMMTGKKLAKWDELWGFEMEE
jgi:hypothetical protein